MKTHPIADLFPMLTDDELKDLAEDIKANGLHHPITVSNGTLIDGRNRLAACELAGVEPEFEELNGADPVAFILSENLARRHMSKGQRAMAGVKAFDFDSVKKQDAARIVGVDNAYITRARQVLDADPALADQVLAGTLPLNEAYGMVKAREKEVQRLTRDREMLAELAPDLNDAVSEEVIELTKALTEAREREQRQKDERRDALDLLERILTLISPDHANEEFIDSWADKLGPLTPRMRDKVQKAGAVLSALAERIEVE